MLLLIDNFDSFTFNLIHSFQALGVQVHCLRASQAALQLCKSLSPAALVIGPGPGSPQEAISSNKLITAFAGKIPILGVCLGHQCIAEIFGGKVVRAATPMHGKVSQIYHDGLNLFKNMPQGFSATRYHSLIVEQHSFPPCLEVTAKTSQGEIMALRHKTLPIEAVQFHPESCMTAEGQQLFGNFLKMTPLSHTPKLA